MFGVVYRITCLVTSRVYIGQTKDFKIRCKEHLLRLKNNKHECLELQQDYNLYGKFNFKFEIIDEGNSRQELLSKETHWIDIHGGIDSLRTYNRMNHKNKSNITRYLISENHIKTLTEEHKQKISNNAKHNVNYGMKGKHHSEDVKQHLSNIKKGTKHSKETCEKISKANKKYSDEFVDMLKKDYINIGTFSGVARKYNLNTFSVSRLIKYGTTNCDKIYK